MLQGFVEKGECDLLGIMLWTKEHYAAPAIDALNHYYGHPDKPIGVRAGGTHCLAKPCTPKYMAELVESLMLFDYQIL